MFLESQLWDVCGNRLVVAMIEASDEELLKGASAAEHCHDRGIRVADGVALFARREGWWRTCFYNPDGSFEALCGNSLLAMASMSLRAGEEAEVRPFARESVRINRSAEGVGATSQGLVRSCTLNLPGIDAVLWDTGSPHAVVHVGDVAQVDLPALARQAAGSTDANLTLWSDAGHEVRARTYERGVEAETRACGTGALAVALDVRRPGTLTLRYPGGVYRIEHHGEPQPGTILRWTMRVDAADVRALAPQQTQDVLSTTAR